MTFTWSEIAKASLHVGLAFRVISMLFVLAIVLEVVAFLWTAPPTPAHVIHSRHYRPHSISP